MQQVWSLPIRTKCGWRFTIKISQHRWSAKYLPILRFLRQQRVTPPASLAHKHGFPLARMRHIFIFGYTHHVSRSPTLGCGKIINVTKLSTLIGPLTQSEDRTRSFPCICRIVNMSLLLTQLLDPFTQNPWMQYPRRIGRSLLIYIHHLSLIHISEPTRLGMISYAVFCLKK